MCSLEDCLGLLWSYFLCTGHTMGTDKLTVCICELLNSLVECFLLSPVHTCSFYSFSLVLQIINFKFVLPHPPYAPEKNINMYMAQHTGSQN